MIFNIIFIYIDTYICSICEKKCRNRSLERHCYFICVGFDKVLWMSMFKIIWTNNKTIPPLFCIRCFYFLRTYITY